MVQYALKKGIITIDN